jgi:hypothetical protein
MSDLPLYLCCKETYECPMCPENLHLSRYLGAEKRADDVHQNL